MMIFVEHSTRHRYNYPVYLELHILHAWFEGLTSEFSVLSRFRVEVHRTNPTGRSSTWRAQNNYER